MLINNVVLSQFLGICPFLGVSKNVKTASGMGLAVIFVITISAAVTYPVYYYLLAPMGLEFLETIVFILIIAFMVQLIELILKKYIPSLHESLGVYLPLITTNCAVLGVAVNNVSDYSGEPFVTGYIYSVARGLFTAAGFMIAIVIMASLRERNEHNDVPEAFRGMPIVLVTAGLMAMAFIGFSGVV